MKEDPKQAGRPAVPMVTQDQLRVIIALQDELDGCMNDVAARIAIGARIEPGEFDAAIDMVMAAADDGPEAISVYGRLNIGPRAQVQALRTQASLQARSTRLERRG